jgi:hypothetical protein
MTLAFLPFFGEEGRNRRYFLIDPCPATSPSNREETDFIKLPVRVIKVYEDGSWDGELVEGEA